MAAGAEVAVKLIGALASPFVMRARVALNLKGVTYEFLVGVYYEFLHGKFGEKSELLLKSNPVYKKIPVLIHNGKPICESMIIVQYIDDVWASSAMPSILPSDPYERAIARFWSVYVDDKLFPAALSILKAQTEEAKKQGIDQLLTTLELLEDAFDKCSNGKGFFGGDSIGYLDIAFGSYLGWIKALEHLTGVKFLDTAKIPLLVGWAECFCVENAVKEVMPTTEELLELIKKLQAVWNAPPAAN